MSEQPKIETWGENMKLYQRKMDFAEQYLEFFDYVTKIIDGCDLINVSLQNLKYGDPTTTSVLGFYYENLRKERGFRGSTRRHTKALFFRDYGKRAGPSITVIKNSATGNRKFTQFRHEDRSHFVLHRANEINWYGKSTELDSSDYVSPENGPFLETSDDGTVEVLYDIEADSFFNVRETNGNEFIDMDPTVFESQVSDFQEIQDLLHRT